MSKEYKFKVGDRVRLINGWSDMSSAGFASGTLVLGDEYVISSIDPDNCWEGIEYPYSLKHTCLCVEECMLEFAEETPKETPPMPAVAQTKTEWTDAHYNFFYTLTDNDIFNKKIKIDPYFVAQQWKIGSKDDSGALWHCFKAIARFGEKNSVEREINALHAQIVRLAELHNVKL